MILMVEGNEGTGKTTLINSLIRRSSSCLVKTGRRFKDLYNLYDMMSKSNSLYLLDRGFITDLVYRGLDREKGDLTLYQIGKLCGDNQSRIKIVFCYHDNSFKNSIERGEDNITVEQVHNLINAEYRKYENLIKCFTNIETMNYNYEYQSVDDVIKFMKGGD